MLGFFRTLPYLYYVMREKLKPLIGMTPKKEMSRLYKVTFVDGTVYFSRVCLSKGYSVKTFISNTISVYNSNKRNPLRQTMITEFETRVFEEVTTLKCEIIFEGLTEEAMKMRDEFIKVTPNCGNSKMSLNNEGRISKEIIRVGKEFSKIVKNSTGDIVSFVDSEWAKRKGYWDVLNFSNRYPLNSKYVQILKPIERI